MADITAETGSMDDETVQIFVNKIDLACTALNQPNEHIEGYGAGIEAAYQLLCEAQAISPDNQAVATEIASLQRVINADQTATSATIPQQELDNGNIVATGNTLSMADQVMQHWETKPTIEIVVCVTEENLKQLADTIDSIATQIYSNWKLTVISNMPSPDPVFSQHSILQWIQTDNFQEILNNTINSTDSDWIGLIKPGDQLDNEALFSVANQDNLQGAAWQMIYADEDHIDTNHNCSQPLRKSEFNLQQCSNSDFIGSFCFTRKSLLQNIGGINLASEYYNSELAMRVSTNTSSSAIGYIPNVLSHRFIADAQANHPLHSNVA